jgi:hypothetical protein
MQRSKIDIDQWSRMDGIGWRFERGLVLPCFGTRISESLSFCFLGFEGLREIEYGECIDG